MIILKIIGVIVAWFIIGTLINIVLYSGLPVSERRESDTGKGLHIILNILTVIFILNLLFS